MTTARRFLAKNGLDNSNKTITNVADPVNNQDVVTKAYFNANAPASNVIFTVKTANYTLVNKDNIAANTNGGAFTLTLPASPSAGMTVKVIDYAGTFDTSNLTIARNGSNIAGLAEDLICNTKNLQVTLNYIDAVQGWKFLASSNMGSFSIIEGAGGAGGGTVGPITYVVKSANYTLVNGDDIAANTTASAFTLTLPASPSAGAEIRIIDYANTFNTNNLTIARNGSNIMGLAEDLICNTSNIQITLNYIDSVQGWKILLGGGLSSFSIIENNTGGGNGNFTFNVKSANYTLVNNDNIAANTTASAFTLTLPATPTIGMTVRIIDYAGTFGTNNLTIARNGSNIMGLVEDLICNTKDLQIILNYIDATQGWKIMAGSGASNFSVIEGAGSTAFTSSPSITGSAPGVFLHESDAGLDLKRWMLVADATKFLVQTRTDADVYVDSPLQLTRSGDLSIKGSLSLTRALLMQAIVTTTASTTATIVDSFAIASYRSASFQLQITSGANYTIVNINVIHNGTTATMVEFGSSVIGSALGTFSVPIASGNLNLTFTPASSASTIVKVVRLSIV